MFRVRRPVCITLIGFLCLIVICGCSLSYSHPEYDGKMMARRDTLFQVSTIDALLEGVYDGVISIDILKQHGDFGIGTFAGLDGEMVGLNDNFYQIKADGIAYKVADSIKTPFAAVTYFDTDQKESLRKDMNFQEMELYLDGVLPTANAFYAIKIEGVFNYMKTRSVPAQQKPYPKLVEVAKDQPVFEFRDISGTMVGFRCPSYVDGINVPGYHLHFISSSREVGGHVLDFRVQEAIAAIDYTPQFFLMLPGNDSEFYHINLGQDKQQELENVEK